MWHALSIEKLNEMTLDDMMMLNEITLKHYAHRKVFLDEWSMLGQRAFRHTNNSICVSSDSCPIC